MHERIRAYQDARAEVDAGVSAADEACVVVRLLGAVMESAPVDCARDEGFVAPPPRGRPLPVLPGTENLGIGRLENVSLVPFAIANAVACVARGMAGAAGACAAAYSDSLSPIQAFTNHRPPAIPRISRLA